MTGTNQTKKRKQSVAEPAEKPNEPIASTVSESESDSDTEPDSEKLHSLLEPYSKDQLIDLISTAAVNNPSLYKYIRDAADREETHRKIFVYGLGWDTTRESLVSAFESCGEIEDCKLVTDKVTGKAKGYAFILFKARKSAMKALKTPQRKINNRITSCQLASVGPTNPSAAAGGKDNQGSAGERKIYVSNVQRDVDKQKLREFFERFGEIETGPIGFDVNTGKSRGFALFVYRTVEGARKALEEPIKMFGGHQLHCQKAADGKNKISSNIASNSNNSNSNSNSNQMQVVHGQQMLQGQGQGLDALTAAQNWALLGQQVGLNPVYGGLLANPGLINPVVAGALTQGVVPTSHVNVGAVGGLAGYGTAQGLQNVYPNAQNRVQGSAGTYPTYTSYTG